MPLLEARSRSALYLVLALIALLAAALPLGTVSSSAAEPTPAAKPSKTVSRYLFTAFTNSSESNMYVYGSDDAQNFWSVQDKAYTPPAGLVRDPSVIKRGGRYYVAYTTAWTGKTFGIATSTDRQKWTHVADIDHGVAANNTWAPEFFTDSLDGKVRIVVSLSTGPTAYRHFQPHVLTALDGTLTKWSKPEPLRGIHPSATHYNGYIDTVIVRRGSTYHAFTKNATGEVIEHAVAGRITGPYTFKGKGDWAGWGDLLEGQTIVRLPNGGYRMFMDGYTVKKYYYSDSTDLVNWTPKKELPGLSGVARHGTVIQETATELPTDNNPALPGYHADPDVIHADGKFWIYPTEDGHPGWSGTRFKSFSSPDLVHWTANGTALDLADVSWCHQNAWAPAVVKKGGTYWMYFSACQSIGVAKSSSPKGPFVDALGKPLLAKGQFGHQSIDPDVFIDDDGTPYLYFGQGGFEAARLNHDMVSFATQPVNITPPGYNEAPTVFKRKGRYYAMWSEDDTRSPNYRVAYGVSDSPLGPFTKAAGNPVLSKDESDQILGTGHNSVIQIPGRDEWYTVYHRFARPGGDGTHREVAIDRMRFNDDGTIPTIKPTQRGINPVKRSTS